MYAKKIVNSIFFLCVILLTNSIAQAQEKEELFLFIDNSNIPTNSFKLDENKYSTTLNLTKGSYTLLISDIQKQCKLNFGIKNNATISFATETKLDNCTKNGFKINIPFPGLYLISFDIASQKVIISRQKQTTSFIRKANEGPCNAWDHKKAITTDVSEIWPDNTLIKDAYSGKSTLVKNGKITFTPAEESEGILLLEKANDIRIPHKFTWDNANIYFLLTDRFSNGDPSNDHSFERKNDYPDEINFATWHGGDFKGITSKLDYLQKLGINAIWVSPIVEQIHGFVGMGPKGQFPVYPYHGYWALDFTKIDPNLGSEKDFAQFVDEAHKRGIRVVVDIVMNHVGYPNLGDMQDMGYPEMANIPNLPKEWNNWIPEDGNFNIFQPIVKVTDKGWDKWWNPDWVRMNHIPSYETCDDELNEQTSCLYWLPDLKTESNKFVTLPLFLQNKKDTLAKNLPNSTVLDYLIAWQTYWVENFGIDGFRADTAKHVEPIVWKQLKQAANKSFTKWKEKNPSKKLDDLPFYLVGEVWGHKVEKDFYFKNGFDALINFDYQDHAIETAQCMHLAEPIYEEYASKINIDPDFNMLTFVSSHDTRLIYTDYFDINLQKRIANSFTFLPGQIQIYYGDETARGNINTIQLDHVPRSDMNWEELQQSNNANLLKHWQKLLNFRLKHPAIATGMHKQLSHWPYTFARTTNDDAIVIVSATTKKF